MRHSFLASGLVAAMVGGFGGVAFGQPYLPSEQNITMGDWVFTPVLVEVSGVRTVEGFLALRESSTLVGSNIGSIWYARSATAPSGWESFGWETQDQWAAIEWVKDEYAIASTYDERWRTTQTPPSPPATPEEPESFDNGVLESDPLSPIATPTPEWDAVVEMLVSAGWAAADIPTEESAAEANCPDDPVVGVLAEIVEAGEAGEDLEQAIVDAWQAFENCLPFCIPVTVVGVLTTPSCGAPGPYGAPVQSTPQEGQVVCSYSRTRTCTQTRLVFVRHWDCSISNCLQTRSKTETETHDCDMSGTLYNGPGVAPDLCPPVTAQTCFGATQGGVFVPTSSTAWSAWSPACP